ncbi:MAG: SH3 domain-containing protein [Lentisphaeria bacterium]|nr:SH3 domain-containing protein [Lentisphaeria bacterium]
MNSLVRRGWAILSRLAACLALSGLAAESPSPDAPRAGTVSATVLNLRAKPAQHYERIGQFSQGDRVLVVGGNEQWFEVRVPADTRAWIASQFLGPGGTVTGNAVRLHSGPGLVFTTFATVNEGAKLTVMGPAVDGWQQVRAPEDATGWVSRAYVRLDEPETAAEEEEAPEGPAAATAEDTPAAVTDPDAPSAAAPETGDRTAAEIPPAGAATTGDGTAPAAAQADEIRGETPAEETPPAAAAPETGAPGTPVGETVAVAEDGSPGVAAPEETPLQDPGVLAAAARAREHVAAVQEVPVGAEAGPPAAGAEVGPDTGGSTAPAESLSVFAVEAVSAAAAADGGTPAVVEDAGGEAAQLVMREGVILSLKSQATADASHVLCLRIQQTAYPVCYLRSSRIELSEWERRNVRLHGRELQVPGWSRPILDVHSVQVNFGP